MAKCKLNHCREQAVHGGRKWGSKRYCAEHGEAYWQKQQEYAMIQRTLRECEQCGDKLSKTRHDAGETLCGGCAHHKERQDRSDWYEQSREREFQEAQGDLAAFAQWVRRWCQLKPLP